MNTGYRSDGVSYERLNQIAMDGAEDDREPNQSDLNSAARGLNMNGKSLSELDEIIKQHEGKSMFASKVIYLAAKQMRAAKARMGAKDGRTGPTMMQVQNEFDRQRRNNPSWAVARTKTENALGIYDLKVGSDGQVIGWQVSW